MAILSAKSEMKTSTTIALTLVALISSSLDAGAGTDQPAHHWRGSRHTVHHRAVARAKTSAPAGGAPKSQPEPANPMLKPYPHPWDGDDDGLSRDPDDCMKGCIGGNPG